jgi:hypothetical protein
MKNGRSRSVPILIAAAAAAGVVVGLALPAAAHEVSTLINGRSIELHSIPGNRMMPNTLTGKQINESTLGTVPRAATLPALKWHRITDFFAGWSAFPGRPPAYAIDAQGIVHLEGAIHGGMPTYRAFEIPADVVGPTSAVDMTVACGGPGQYGELSLSAGSAVVSDGGVTSYCDDFTSLDGVTFKAT